MVFRDVFGRFRRVFGKIIQQGRTWSTFDQSNGRRCSPGSNLETKGANEPQMGEGGRKRGEGGSSRPHSTNQSHIRPLQATFDPTLTEMRFLMQTKCFMLETYVLNLCA